MTNIHLYDVVDLDELTWLMANGYVREQTHPSEPLRILNYTDRAQTKPELFDEAPSLNQCRGLIWNTTDGTIVARPFRKFWNYGQAQAATISLGTEVDVLDKADGSLGILYRGPNSGKLYIATRGSFTSDQAIWASNWLRQYGDPEAFEPTSTYLFEILVGWNRIVLDYDWDGLVLLEIVDIETGKHVHLPHSARVLQARTARNDRGEHEGHLEGLEAVRGLPASSATARHGEELGSPKSDSSGVGPAKSGASTGAGQAGRPAPAGATGGAEAAALPGLQGDLSAGVHGLGSRSGQEAVQRQPGQDASEGPGGDREVRSSVLELSSDQDSEARFRLVESFGRMTYAEALALPLDRPNREGYVIRNAVTGERVKLKQEDYLQLHRIVFGLSTRRVYEAILAGKTLFDILEPLPDEFHKWTHGVYTELQNAFKRRYSDLVEAYQNTMSYAFHSGIVGLDEDEGWYVDRDKRGALARLFQEHDNDAWAAFAQLDGKDITKRIWKDLEPPAGQLPGSYEPKLYVK